MDQKGCPSENVQFKLRESVQIAAVLCKCCLEDWLFHFLLDHVIPILPFFSCPHSECQAPDGARRTADVKKKMKTYSERIDSKRSFSSLLRLFFESSEKFSMDFSKNQTGSYLKDNVALR